LRTAASASKYLGPPHWAGAMIGSMRDPSVPAAHDHRALLPKGVLLLRMSRIEPEEDAAGG